MTNQRRVRLIRDHTDDDYHEWIWLPSWGTVRRDAIGRRLSSRMSAVSASSDWFPMRCNNRDCDAWALVRSTVLAEVVEEEVEGR